MGKALTSSSPKRGGSMERRALITGITGMDGSIMADYLLSLGFKVYGLVRRTASPNFWRIEHLLNDPRLQLLDGDITAQDCVYRAIEQAEPEVVFNLAAQSFVPYSWSSPVSTFHATALGVLNVLEAIRNIDKGIKFYQASSSEMFGKVLETPQKETTPFYPRSPYGVAKVAAHYATLNYQESFGIHAASGILFNHEHERRGAQFVTRKITKGIAEIFHKREKREPFEPLRLGNLEAKRDWGYAEDYVKGMYKIVYHPKPQAFVIATGVTRTVRQWCEATVAAAVQAIGETASPIEWQGKGLDEIGFFKGEPILGINPEFYRPAEVDLLLGDYEKAKKVLGWEPETPFEEMVGRMVRWDLNLLEKERCCV
jgi:GDPmannose 4,6-dehydratase